MNREGALQAQALSPAAVALALMNLATPAAFVWLLRPVLEGHGSICNRTAIWARGVVAATCLAGAIAVAMRRVALGRRISVGAVALNVGFILWVWSQSGFVFTVEIVGWLIVDALTVFLVVLIGDLLDEQQ